MIEKLLAKWANIVSILGYLLVVVNIIIAYRKKLYTLGLTKFEENYRSEMDSFKKEVRTFNKIRHEENQRILERVADLFEQTHRGVYEIKNLITVQDKFRSQLEKRIEHIEDELSVMDEKIDDVKLTMVKNGLDISKNKKK